MAADPQVPSAAPWREAIQKTLEQFPPGRDIDICTLASGLAHERRIRMIRALLNGLETACADGPQP